MERAQKKLKLDAMVVQQGTSCLPSLPPSLPSPLNVLQYLVVDVLYPSLPPCLPPSLQAG